MVVNYGNQCAYITLKPSQNKKGKKIPGASFLVSYFTAGSWEKDTENGAPRIFLALLNLKRHWKYKSWISVFIEIKKFWLVRLECIKGTDLGSKKTLNHVRSTEDRKVSKFQNECIKSRFLQEHEPNVAQGRNPYNFWFIFREKRWLH